MAFDKDDRPAKRVCIHLQRPIPLYSEPPDSPSPKTLFFHPKPDRLSRPCRSFLKDFVDPPCTDINLDYHPDVVRWIRSSGAFLSEYTDISDEHHGQQSLKNLRVPLLDPKPLRRCFSDSTTTTSNSIGMDNRKRPATAPASDKERARTTPDFRLRFQSIHSDDFRHSTRSPLSTSVFTADRNGTSSPRTTASSKSKTFPQRPPSVVSRSGCRTWMAEHKRFLHGGRHALPHQPSQLLHAVALRSRTPLRTEDDIKDDEELSELFLNDTTEWDVERYYNRFAFEEPRSSPLKCTSRAPMREASVPRIKALVDEFPVSTPYPDLLYGYGEKTALSDNQKTVLRSFCEQLNGTNKAPPPILPFLVVEYKACDGNMWEATNQCMNGDHSCLKIIGTLNERLRDCGGSDKVIDPAVFSFAINHETAKLHVSWKDEELDYYFTAPIKG